MRLEDVNGTIYLGGVKTNVWTMEGWCNGKYSKNHLHFAIVSSQEEWACEARRFYSSSRSKAIINRFKFTDEFIKNAVDIDYSSILLLIDGKQYRLRFLNYRLLMHNLSKFSNKIMTLETKEYYDLSKILEQEKAKI